MKHNNGTVTSNGLYDHNKSKIGRGQIGFGPDSDFSFGVDPDEQAKIKNGFYVRYTGMIVYEYTRK